MPSGADINSSTATNGTEQNENTNHINETILSRSISHDPTSYVQRARTTRAAPPKPATNPLQFVQIKPCNLYQSAQAQLKRAEEVKKVKEVKKEEPEDWQSNLDNWKSSRRKRVEHIIDRVVEVKKLELEEHDKSRRKSKTFSEMLEERGSKGRKVSLPIYTEDDVNDLSDLGIGTSSASGKSSLSEDFDNHSVISDNQDAEKVNSDVENHSNPDNGNRDYISSPGYDTSSSTAPASSPDLCEYTYEGAIQDYKSRVSRTQQTSNFNGYTSASTSATNYPKDELAERSISLDFGKSLADNSSILKRPMMTKIENQLNRFAFKLDYNNDSSEQPVASEQPNNLPNVNVLKRRELFEKETLMAEKTVTSNRVADEFGPTTKSLSIKERLSNLEKHVDETKEDILLTKLNRLVGDFNSVKEIRTNIEHPIDGPSDTGVKSSTVKIGVPVVPLKARLTSLHSSGVTRNNDETNDDDDSPIVTAVKEKISELTIAAASSEPQLITIDRMPRNLIESDRDDSGIQTADVSCCVSQTDEPLLDEDVSTAAETVKHVEHVDDEKQLNGSTMTDNNNDDDVETDDEQPLEENDKTESVTTDDFSTTIRQSTIDEPITSADDIVDQIADIADIAADDKSTNEQDTSVSQSESFVYDLNDTVEGKLVVDFKNENSIKSISSDGCGNAIDIVGNTTTDKKPSVTNNKTSLSSASSSSTPTSVMVVNQLDNCNHTSNVNSKLDSILTSTIDTDNISSSKSPIYSNCVNNDNCSSSSNSSNIDDGADSVVSPPAIEEVTCKKMDVRTIRDPTHIPTPCISVGRGRQKKSLSMHDKYGTNDTVFESVEDLLKAGDELKKESTTIENSAAKNERIKCQIVGVLEKTRTASTLPTSSDEKSSQGPPLPSSPSKFSNLLTGKSIKPISPSKSTTVNIFDFIKRNLLNERTDTVPTAVSASTIPNSDVRIGKSTFYEPLKSEKDDSVKICPKSDSIDSNASDINSLLDEVLNKLGDDEK